MSGESIPYQLRPNKAIDRYAFLELLSKINKMCPISDYHYIGFGGHSLEDFKYIHTQFNIQKMTSIEIDEDVYERQKFNRPHNCIDCYNQSSDKFIDEFERSSATIIWLDYTKANELRKQIDELQATLSKLEQCDIIKITVNSHAASYVASDSSPGFDIKRERIRKLRDMLGDTFPAAEITEDMMTEKKFPDAMCLVLKNAANLAMQGQSDIYFQPLTTFTYRDGQCMLTLTGTILEHSQAKKFFETTGIDKWELSNIQWQQPQRINLPELTIRERLFIDSLLPQSSAEEIQQALKFKFDKKESLKMLETYIRFYRQSPYFSRIML
ncbi:O-methyltransferase [Sphaerospermopsis sp. LEGE 08334]|jgi:hypothetical protein|uniref:O-methyltransferase n=1 Tax=Sphaerospermopsis sp. LEGE 08334 TaxID=1828651 RepID=UPI0018820791|nr:O-methyltransferase [Sphaerospermopsis sp. LEGE 08334]MBE9055716.1 hypothetical protein [Sphaerospermopsis sp. LEGE 08334]